MAEKGILVTDAATGESVALRDAVLNDNDGNPRVIQLTDRVGRRTSFDVTSATRTVTVTSGTRGDTFDLSSLDSEVASTALTMGDSDSVAVAVQFTEADDDSKIIVTPIIYDDNDTIISLLEPKSFNMIHDATSSGTFSTSSAAVWTLSGATNAAEYSTITGIGTMSGLMMKPDGTKLIWSDSGFGKLKQGTLSTPYLISSYGSETEITESNYYFQFNINPDGDKMLALDSGGTDTIILYNLSSAWDVTTAVESATTGTLQASTPTGFSVSQDGLHLYVQEGYYIDYYTMSSAWDPSTISFVARTNTYSSWTTQTFNYGKINNDGSKYFMMDKTNGVIKQLNFSTPYDPSTYTVDGTQINFTSAVEGNPKMMEVAGDGETIYFYGADAKTIHKYDVTPTAGTSYMVTPLQTWNSLGSKKIGFHIYHDSTNAVATTVNVFASLLTSSDEGYKVLEKSTSGDAGSFAVNMRYGIGS